MKSTTEINLAGSHWEASDKDKATECIPGQHPTRRGSSHAFAATYTEPWTCVDIGPCTELNRVGHAQRLHVWVTAVVPTHREFVVSSFVTTLRTQITGPTSLPGDQSAGISRRFHRRHWSLLWAGKGWVTGWMGGGGGGEVASEQDPGADG